MKPPFSLLARPLAVFCFAASLASSWCEAQGYQWRAGDGYRYADLTVSEFGKAGFTLLSPEQTGINFTNLLGYIRSETNQNLLNGAGVAAGDFDGDGLCDLYFCNLDGRSALYRNLASWKFEDVTDRLDVGCTNQASRAAVFADINGDGHLDLLVGSLGGPNACFVNDGHGHFTNVTKAAGLVLKAGCHSLALADIDGDGDLDLYIACNGENSILRSGGSISVRTGPGGKPIVTGRYANRVKIVNGQMIDLGEPDVLYLNDGKGVFTPVSWTDGTFLTEDGKPLKAGPLDLGLSAMFHDINGDGFPDLYVCNDFQTPDRIWINDGKGHFRALRDLAIRSTPHFSMGVDFADIDRDGWDDFFVSDMLSRFHKLRMIQSGATNPAPETVGEVMDRHQIRRNALQLNRGDLTYANIANFAGVDASDWSWSVVFLDVDLDGYEDLLIATGHAYDTQDLDMFEKLPDKSAGPSGMRIGKNLKDYPPLRIPNVAFHNRGNRTFDEVGAAWRFDSTRISHGIALTDLDNDGDLDVVVSCLWDAPLIYRNDSPAPRVAVRLKGKSPNTQGIGAKIKVFGGVVPVQTQEMICGGRYLAGDDPMRVFAAGSLTNRLTIEVTWRSGVRSVIADAKPNRIYELDESGAKSAPPAARAEAQPVFKDVSNLIAHKHEDLAFDDLVRQPLLHKRLSQLGPGVAWYDFNGDGHDDLIIGTGHGGALAVYRGDGKGVFAKLADALAASPPDDITGVVGWTPVAGQRTLLAGLANYETTAANQPSVLRFDLASSLLKESSALPGSAGSVGPLAVADLDADGSLDLFVGGRVIAARYPQATASRLYRNRNGQLQLDVENNRLLENVGLVSGAVFSDLNGDGLPELILACEWGPVRVFQNTAGKMREVTADLGLDRFMGWWNGVTTGDLDGDGKPDIIASNWGLNSSFYRPTPTSPLRIYFGDFDGNGTVDLLEAYTDPESGRIVPRRDLLIMTPAWPLLRVRFPTHRAYSLADARGVLGDQFAKAQQVVANSLASMLFLNRGNHFEAVPLPDEAQFAAAFSVNVSDMDGDGHEDIFLSQNFFGTRAEDPRLDAGRGLWLRGNGAGQLTPVPGRESGVQLYGEQRGAALGDFDEDGRVDLVVTQNSARTVLYRNVTARPGLRVRLDGPPGNPSGIGASVRLTFGNRMGPAREIHGGSGYWSQDSAVQVMATPDPPTQVWVRWPGGKVTTVEVPAGAVEITVSSNGTVRSIRKLALAP